MDEIPVIKIRNEPSVVDTKRINDIFSKLKIEDAPKELVEIRKNQLKEHSKCSFICNIFESLFNMIGCTDEEFNRLRIKQFKEELKYLHPPFYLEIPFYPQYTYGKEAWEEWELWELYDNYYTLCMEKGWEDFYILNNLAELKKYQILDMINDLLVHEKIYGYDPCAFTKGGDDLLNNFDKEVKIPVRVIQ